MIPNTTRYRSLHRLWAPFVCCVAAVLGPPAGYAAEDAGPTGAASGAEATTLEHDQARVYKTDAEWRRLLSPGQYMVTRLKATEPAFSGKYSHGHYKGTFQCVCCGAPLFDARTKFESGTGWPSFWRPISNQALTKNLDRSEPELRVEVNCARCGAHIGHVFQDGPPPTGLRFCTNSIALKLEPEPTRSAASKTPDDPPTATKTKPRTTTRAVHRRGSRY